MENSKLKIKIAKSTLQPFEVTSCLKHGNVLSPVLFFSSIGKSSLGYEYIPIRSTNGKPPEICRQYWHLGRQLEDDKETL